MLGKRVIIFSILGMGCIFMPLGQQAIAATKPAVVPFVGVTASRPGLRVLGSPAVRKSDVAHTALSSPRSPRAGEGSGRSFCRSNDGHALGASFDNVYACGPATGNPDDFDSVGFQCVELAERFLWVNYGAFITGVPDGRHFVAMAAAQLDVAIGTPGVGALPAPGDVISLWGPAPALIYGHTAVVTSVSVNGYGNGVIEVMEENGSKTGWDQLTVSNWRETYSTPSWLGGMYYYTHVEWLELKPNPLLLPNPDNGSGSKPYHVLDGVNIHAGPALTDTIVSVTTPGMMVLLLATKNSFTEIQAPDGLTGWVMSRFIQHPSRGKDKGGRGTHRAGTLTIRAHLRTGPSLYARIIKWVPARTRLSVMGQVPQWDHVRLNAKQSGYIWSAFIQPVR